MMLEISKKHKQGRKASEVWPYFIDFDQESDEFQKFKLLNIAKCAQCKCDVSFGRKADRVEKHLMRCKVINQSILSLFCRL